MPSSYAPHYGGVEQVARTLVSGLTRAGDHPLVVTNRWPKSLSATEVVDGAPVVREVFRVPALRARHLGGWAVHSRRTRLRLRAALVDHGCDVINVHCVSTNGRYALDLSRALRLPVVVSLHGELTADADAVYQRSALLRRTWRRLLDQAELVTAPSSHTLHTAELAYGRGFGGRGKVVPNAVDLPALDSPVESGEKDRRVRRDVLVAGRLVRVKGFDIVIDAWARIAAAPASSGHRLLVAGDGPELEALRDQADQAGIGSRVWFLGRLDRAALAETMSRAALVVVPSREEAFGLTAAEALALGTPVVASRVGGLPELLADGAAGRLVTPGSSEELAAAIREVLCDGVAPGTVEHAASVVRALSAEHYVNTMRACYQEVVGRCG